MSRVLEPVAGFAFFKVLNGRPVCWAERIGYQATITHDAQDKSLHVSGGTE